MGLLESTDTHAMELKALKEAHATLCKKLLEVQDTTREERIRHVEELLNGMADRYTEELAAAHAELRHVSKCMSAMKDDSVALQGLVKSHAGLEREKGSLKDRLSRLEETLGNQSHEQLQKCVSVCQVHDAALDELNRANLSLARENAVLDAHHTALRQRLDRLESMLPDSADKHADALGAAIVECLHSRRVRTGTR